MTEYCCEKMKDNITNGSEFFIKKDHTYKTNYVNGCSINLDYCPFCGQDLWMFEYGINCKECGLLCHPDYIYNGMCFNCYMVDKING